VDDLLLDDVRKYCCKSSKVSSCEGGLPPKAHNDVDELNFSSKHKSLSLLLCPFKKFSEFWLDASEEVDPVSLCALGKAADNSLQVRFFIFT
jgi:hypothetical protein